METSLSLKCGVYHFETSFIDGLQFNHKLAKRVKIEDSNTKETSLIKIFTYHKKEPYNDRNLHVYLKEKSCHLILGYI